MTRETMAFSEIENVNRTLGSRLVNQRDPNSKVGHEECRTIGDYSAPQIWGVWLGHWLNRFRDGLIDNARWARDEGSVITS